METIYFIKRRGYWFPDYYEKMTKPPELTDYFPEGTEIYEAKLIAVYESRPRFSEETNRK